MAAAIAVQGAEQAFGFDHLPQPRHHGPGRFFLDQLRVIPESGVKT
jgi:hypothetical protein